ncbi:MAG: hypothetical protein IJ629_00680 [Clostridia bacterium]|nr:hypothetical protein [Clostridia bacterium]
MFSNNSKTAKAIIKGGKRYPQIYGTISFEEIDDGTLLTAQVYGLPSSNNDCKRKIFRSSYS